MVMPPMDDEELLKKCVEGLHAMSQFLGANVEIYEDCFILKNLKISTNNNIREDQNEEE